MTASPHPPVAASSLRLATLALAATVLPCTATPLLSQESGDTPPAEDRWTPAVSMRYLQVSGVAISPDGSRIAYVVREPLMEGEKSEYRSHIWVADANGGRNLQFTRGESPASGPAFSPDGRWLAFTTARSGSNQIWVIPLHGGEAHQVTEVKSGVGQYRRSPGGDAIAFVMRDPQTEEEEKAAKEKRDVILVDQDFKYGHIYTVPFEPAATETAEATRITEGDFHVTSFDWAPDGQRLVFGHQADPRINTGRLSGDIAVVGASGGEVTQLVTGPAHPDSLLLMGWSYGGYMTSFAVTQTDRFRAASMGAGLPNLISMVTTTDIGDYLVGHMGEEYFDNYEAYEKHSAIYHIGKVTTPTQVIHGAQDLRVPFTQGQEFFNSLRRLGVETEMVVYPRTPHGPREPKFLMDVPERILTWFEKHLRPAKPAADR